eukprot:scaffold10803_cov51-Phaeocystis_antarctica.AAC.1
MARVHSTIHKPSRDRETGYTVVVSSLGTLRGACGCMLRGGERSGAERSEAGEAEQAEQAERSGAEWSGAERSEA